MMELELSNLMTPDVTKRRNSFDRQPTWDLPLPNICLENVIGTVAVRYLKT